MQDPGVPTQEQDPTTAASGLISSDEKLWAMLSYVLGFAVSFLAPLIIYFVKKDQSRFVAYHALQCLFIHVVMLVLGLAITVLSMIPVVGWIAGCVLGIAGMVLGIAGLVYAIIAAIKSFNGEWYEIPYIAPYARQYSSA